MHLQMILNLILKIRSLQLRLPRELKFRKDRFRQRNQLKRFRKLFRRTMKNICPKKIFRVQRMNLWMVRQEKQPSRNRMKRNPMRMIRKNRKQMNLILWWKMMKISAKKTVMKMRMICWKEWISSMILIMQRQWRFLSEKLRNPNLRKKQKNRFQKKKKWNSWSILCSLRKIQKISFRGKKYLQRMKRSSLHTLQKYLDWKNRSLIRFVMYRWVLQIKHPEQVTWLLWVVVKPEKPAWSQVWFLQSVKSWIWMHPK